VAPKDARVRHWTRSRTVAVARPDTNLIPPGTQYGATLSKAEKGNRLRYPGLASPGRTPATPRLSSQDETRSAIQVCSNGFTATVLQPG
jgi:hypothetical protein